MIKPTIHLNGSDPGRLSELALDASKAISEAIQKVADAYPNARDYYPQGDGVAQKAMDEHNERLRVLQAMRREYLEMFEFCHDAEYERDERRKARR